MVTLLVVLHHLWLGERPLMEVFPRLYRINRNKKALVQDCYRDEGNQLSWLLDFQRDLRSFEDESRTALFGQLKEFPISPGDVENLFVPGILLVISQSKFWLICHCNTFYWMPSCTESSD